MNGRTSCRVDSQNSFSSANQNLWSADGLIRNENRINLMIVALKIGSRKSQSSDHDTIAWNSPRTRSQTKEFVFVEQMLRQFNDDDMKCNRMIMMDCATRENFENCNFTSRSWRNCSSGNENYRRRCLELYTLLQIEKVLQTETQQQYEASILSAEKPSSAKSKWAKMLNRFELG